jgi:protein DGCR14
VVSHGRQQAAGGAARPAARRAGGGGARKSQRRGAAPRRVPAPRRPPRLRALCTYARTPPSPARPTAPSLFSRAPSPPPRLEAIQSGDPVAIRRAQLNIARRRAGLRTPLPGETPAPATGGRFTSTPGTGAFRTPAMTPLPRPATGAATPAGLPGGGGGAGPDADAALLGEDGGAMGSRAAAAAALDAAGAAGARAPRMSLDRFLSHYTGEDNASFEGLLEAHNARKRAKVAHHLEGKNAPLQLEGPHNTDGYGSGGQAPSSLVLWKFEPKNRLYYDSSQQPVVPYSAAEKAAMVAGPPKAVRHAATRLSGDVEEEQAAALAAAGLAEPEAAAGGALGAAAAAAGSARDPAEAVAAGAAPRVGQVHGGAGARAYLRTPSVAPGAGGASPLVTWGEIAATPLRLVDAADEDLSGLGLDLSGEPGPSFKLPQVRRREAAAAEAFEARRAARRPSAASGGGGGKSGTPLLDAMRRGAPGTPLSSAGQRLAAQMGRGRTPGSGGKGAGTGMLADGSLQQRLRASYGGTPAATPGGGATPRLGGSTSRATPQLGPRGGRVAKPPRGPAARAPTVVAAGGAASGAGAGAGAGGSITDDLLNLPPRK